MIPVIETERLILRAPELRDLDAYAAHKGSDRSRHEGGPYTPTQVWHEFIGGLGHWMVRGYGCWAIEEKATGRFAGLAGVTRHLNYPEDELGWTLVAEAEGRGIAHEASITARDHARAHLGRDELVSYIDPDNARSIRLAERLGATRDPDAATPDHAGCLVFRHPNPQVQP